MKTLISMAATVLALAAAGAVQAQDPQVEVAGTAERSCTLPATWNYHSSTGGAGSSQISGSTWSIPASLFADASGTAVTGPEVAIRLRGDGFCNTSHEITVTSERGGLAAGDAGTPPTGFANRRAIHYEAYWVAGGTAGGTSAFGPKANLTASAPGASHTAVYAVSGTRAPPGNRFFDLRIGMPRGALGMPLVAGNYSDTVTVTIALAP